MQILSTFILVLNRNEIYTTKLHIKKYVHYCNKILCDVYCLQNKVVKNFIKKYEFIKPF